MTSLADFLAELARRKWQWGETDCLIVLADWIKQARGIDPAAHYRGLYRDAAGAEAFITHGGGLLALVSNALFAAGFTATSVPSPGDVCVVRAPCSQGEGIALRDTGAISMGGDHVAIFTPDCGVVIAPLPLRAAWRV